MLNNLPRIIVPVSTFTGQDSVLTGTIVISGKTITGTNTLFVGEINPGAELYVNDVMVGMISRIDSDTKCYLEEEATAYSGAATIRNFTQSDFGSPITMSDILVRTQPTKKYLATSTILTPYVVSDGDTPENVSYKFYGTPLYHWIILIINEITDPREEWPLSERQLTDMITLKYPDNLSSDVYEWRDTTTGYVVDYNAGLAASGDIYSVSIYEYETEKNESKRNIKLLEPVYIQQFITAYNQAPY